MKSSSKPGQRILPADFLDHPQLVFADLRDGPVQMPVAPIADIAAEPPFGMLDVDRRERGPGGLVPRSLGAEQHLVAVAIVHPQRDKRRELLLATTLREHLDHVAARRHVFGPAALGHGRSEPFLHELHVLAERIHLAFPPRHVTKPRLEHVNLDARPRRLVHRALDHLRPKRRCRSVRRRRRFQFERLALGDKD